MFPGPRVALFVDGCFWHGCPEHGHRPKRNSQYWAAKIERNLARDRRNDSALAEAGWLVVRAWEHERPDDVAERVAVVVTDRRRNVWRARPG